MIYYTRHKYMAALHYVYADVYSGHHSNWMIYYTHHKNMAAPHYVYVDVSSDYHSA
jgi:hypothetical protein